MSKIDTATYYYNGKVVQKKDLPKNAKHLWTEFKHNKYYGDEAYKKKQDDNASKFFKKQREMREDRDAYHG